MSQRMQILAATALSLSLTLSPLAAAPKDAKDIVTFEMVVSAGAKTCLPNARAQVTIQSSGSVETMDVTVAGLPPNTDFAFFVLQVPKAPFGIAWYQGDIVTDKRGRGHQQFVGVFSTETFTVAPGSTSAPSVFNGPFPNATINPSFNPIQMYHLGFWFDSPQAAAAAGCPATVTPFNGQHNAGIQVMNTSNFPDDHGPLRGPDPVIGALDGTR
jgi:hypothetical protein